mgnify:CR=1 FL=1
MAKPPGEDGKGVVDGSEEQEDKTGVLSKLSHEQLGEILVREKVVSPDKMDQARREVEKRGGRLAGVLAQLGLVEENKLVNFMSRQYGVPSLALKETDIDPEVINLIPRDVCERHILVPVNRHGSTLIVAMSDPSNIYAIDDVKFLTGYNVEVVVASEQDIKKAINTYYESKEFSSMLSEFEDTELELLGDEESVDIDELERSTEEAPVVRLVNLILLDAIKRQASDIHIEPYEREFRVRYRIDGVLYEMMNPPVKLKNAITSRIKIMSELDIAERRLPQDGRIQLRLGRQKQVDFRVSVLPTLHGEKIVLRILDKSALSLNMVDLGFEEQTLSIFKEAIHQPYGMVLVTGPTGSGKTTTLYSALMELNQVSENVATAEDPVEITMEGINQVAINDNIGMNFAAALRSFLRQDPDIIMVGEIRDFETAEIAVKAALTGHLVLSTIHTNDAPSTVNRLLNMGVEPFLVTASLNAIVAQRLARRVCGECAEPTEVAEESLIEAGMPEDDIGKAMPMRGAGCGTCNDTGYKGRVALYEVLEMTDHIKECILQGYSAVELKREAIQGGMRTLRQAGLKKLAEGRITLDEVIRVSRSD